MFRWLSGSGGSPGWPATLGPLRTRAGTVTLRPVKVRDGKTWSELRIRNQNSLLPWEPTGVGSWADRHQPASWPPLFAVLKSEAKRGTILPFVIELDDQYVGQLTVGNIQRGAVRSAWIGYWVDNAHAGQGIATAAVALGVDHCFGPVGLHRLDATVQPANEASQKVLKNIGFRQEGLLVRYMDVNKRWRDHMLFALTAEEVVGSATEALVRSGRASFR
ncbi:GNAT family protein [Gordonia rubripertincta]|uniref:GNAT family N-acetyltransferase n=2 Tax=Gordonia rubripertincta TaxID=36822 RepID=A0AAW6R3N2_GORRU|nr:GNAT family protein [Gordonia rubripertincta]ASR02259.1 Putative ribosomal N-acetyltransferase YdaF [Gordonia rubripertincta]MBM7277189.1 GNAT family N-acetyltransferase [Gordonia rubripertincta]MDG6780457.1 GNAT family protein [Gordonia rubripertincta]NKY64156.1 GNAT family N-acetyltransferase [Gordonia rubripertincta]QMU20653.1 GNAT family N-acetyltransferase [Gordonia rubripertincta]